MSANSSTLPFDPFTQSLTLIDRQGRSVKITIPDINEFLNYSVEISINYAAQFGASLILLIVLLLLTRPEKRRAPVFVLNCISLVVNIVRILLFILYFTSPFVDIYASFGQDYSHVPSSAYGTQVAAAVLTLVLLAIVEASLCLQVSVVLVTLRRIYRRVILGFSVLVASLAITIRLAYCVENIKAILSLVPSGTLQWMAEANNICTTISICWFCVVFCAKLGMSIRQRRRLGVGQWGPTQIIFIMGCQTLLIPGKSIWTAFSLPLPIMFLPRTTFFKEKALDVMANAPHHLPLLAIFSILQFITPVPAISSNVLTTVIIFLPLSSLWASATVTHNPSQNRSSNTASSSYGGGTPRVKTSSSLRTKIFGSGASGYGTSGLVVGAGDDTRQNGRPGWLSPDSGISMQNHDHDHHNHHHGHGGVERDLEAQGLETVVERKG